MRVARSKMGWILVFAGLLIAVIAVAWELGVVLGQPVAEHAGHEPAVAVHSAAATAAVVIGVLLATVGARAILLQRAATPEATALFAASTLLFADGILHLDLVGEHLSTLPFAVFFMAAGAVQLVLGFALFRGRPLVYLLSILVTVGLIGLFFLSRLVAVPFAEGPEGIEALGVLSKAVEFGALVALGFLLYRWRVGAKAETPTPPAA